MNARLLILLAAAAGMAVYLVFGQANTSKPPTDSGVSLPGEPGVYDQTKEEIEILRQRQTPLEQRKLPGEEPLESPQFAVTVDVNIASGKNQLCFNISETHGYYAETFNLEFWYAGDDGNIPREESKMGREEHLDKFLEANKTLRMCMELVPAEMDRIDGKMGQSQNWAARIVRHNRARVKNPDPLPEI